MEFQLTTASTVTSQGCAIVPVFSNKQLSQSAKALDAAQDGWIQKVLGEQGFSGEMETSLLLPGLPKAGPRSVLLVGCGDPKAMGSIAWRKISNHAALQLKTAGITKASWYLADLATKDYPATQLMQQAVAALNQTYYQFYQFKTTTPPNFALKQVDFVLTDVNAMLKAQLQQSLAVAKGVSLYKDLANAPSNVCTPTYLAEHAKKLESQFSAIKTQVIDEAEMKKLGMGAFLAVSKGSTEPPKFIILEYRGGNSNAKPHVLVGKGITFDSGGLSIKPSEKMDEMKYDMCGAATVLGTLLAIAEMKLPINVVGAIASTENLPSGHATKPGDIVKSLSGQTIEILNTDAEGRLVLCDALTYIERYNPASVIDIATLTGAMIITLGSHITGMMSNNEDLVAELIHAGRKAEDLLWYLPMNEDYEKALDSNFADIANINPGWDRSAGSITAGCFLSKFTRQYRWAHLDIAGTAWNIGKFKGATGRPVPALVQYLVDRSHDAS